MEVIPGQQDRHHPVETPSGPGRLHLARPGSAPARLVLGHGAGGGVAAPDLLAARAAGLALGLQVVRFEQPWRVRGRRVAEAPPRLDAAWLAALAALTALDPPGAPARVTVLGGRSAGARVACRTAALVPPPLPVAGVLCLAFPLRPPGSAADRAAELAVPGVPRLVVQGGRDAFGLPAAAPGVRVHVVPGADHGFAVRRRDGRTAGSVADEITAVVQAWLGGLGLPATRPGESWPGRPG